MLKISVRTAMLLVLLVGVFLGGYKLGQQQPVVDGPGPRAMAFVASLNCASDEEADAVYFCAKWAESAKPGFLAANPTVAFERLDDPLYKWRVKLTDRRTGKTTEYQGCGFDGEGFRKKRDEGFKLVAQ